MSHPVFEFPEEGDGMWWDGEPGCLYVGDDAGGPLTFFERVQEAGPGRCFAHDLGRCETHAPLGLDANGQPILTAEGALR